MGLTDERILAFAKEQGYDGAEYVRRWNGLEVYQPTFQCEGDDVPAVGLPCVILVDGDSIRLSAPEEGFAELRDRFEN